MPSWDHFVDAVNDYAFVKATDGDPEREALNNRRRLVAVGFIPGLLLVGVLGGVTGSGTVAIAALTVLVAATALGIFLPGKKS